MERSVELQFLKDTYDLHKSPEVTAAMVRRRERYGEVIPDKPYIRIQNYFSRFHEVLNRSDDGGKQEGILAIKRLLHTKFVIKKQNIPESYWENQMRIHRERGESGDFDPDEWNQQRDRAANVIINDQKKSLNSWVDYLTSTDAPYSDAMKYWVMRNIVSLSEYDNEKKMFPKRSLGTTQRFPDLNREALAYVMDVIGKRLTGREDEISDDETPNGENFAKLYAWGLRKTLPDEERDLTRTEGKWVKYDRGSDPTLLVASLQGKATQWCTAGESTAEAQLADGDFYVYYSVNSKGDATIPRIAIRMDDSEIAEVRGVGKDQNLDPYIVDVLHEKLQEFPDNEAYLKKEAHTRRLTELDEKVGRGESLTTDDLRFLYSIDEQIETFGYSDDPRIEELLTGRDIRVDLSQILNVTAEEISLSEDEALTPGIKYHIGDLRLNSLESAEGITFPQLISVRLPEFLDDEDHSSMRFTQNENILLVVSARIGVSLNGLTSTKGLSLPDKFNGWLSLNGITSPVALELPTELHGGLSLNGLTSAENVRFPEGITGLFLNGLTTATGLELPEYIDGSLELDGLISAEGLVLPKQLSGTLSLDGLESADGLNIPENYDGLLSLNGLRSAKGLVIPDDFKGTLLLRGLESAHGLVLPEYFEGSLFLNGLTTPNGLVLPRVVQDTLDLGGLTSAKDLRLPESVGALYLHGLTSSEGLVLPEKISWSLQLGKLQDVTGVTFPREIDGILNLDSVKSLKGVTLPEKVTESIYLASLTSIEGLEFVQIPEEGIVIRDLPYESRIILKEKYPELNIQDSREWELHDEENIDGENGEEI